MKILCIWEHNGEDSLVYAGGFPGAFARGPSKEAALAKLPGEVASYLRWLGGEAPGTFEVEVVQEKASELDIRDADSDVLFDSERAPLPREEYERLKALALRSAGDFLAIYEAVPEKDGNVLAPRKTFYGHVPRTAREMYEHTKSVNSYYFAEVGAEADNDGDIRACRERGFAALEQLPGFLDNAVMEGSYGEDWTVRKMLRRFLWHDRIHAKALLRMARAAFPAAVLPDPYRFEG